MKRSIITWRVLLSVLTVAIFALFMAGGGTVGAQSKSEHPAEHPKAEQSTIEHPKGEKPKTEHPAEQPKVEHPAGQPKMEKPVELPKSEHPTEHPKAEKQ